ncbi:MAG TPA: hypothetical protein DEP23_07990 [Ruminococcaceae bacterium]|nr:hypothetical protein [Oscillospiraceae bacterium]
MGFIFAVSQQVVGRTLVVKYSDGSVKMYDAIRLGCEWFRMSNDCFFEMYGFNFNPHAHGLYDICRKLVHGE